MNPEITTKYTVEYKFFLFDIFNQYPEITIAIAVTISLVITVKIVFKIVGFFRKKDKKEKIIEMEIEK